MNVHPLVGRVILSGKATLRDLQEWHDLDDLLDLNEVLDVELEMSEPPPDTGARR